MCCCSLRAVASVTPAVSHTTQFLHSRLQCSACLKKRPALYANAWGLAWRIDVADGRPRAYHVLLIMVNNQECARAIMRFHQVVTQVQIAHRQAHLQKGAINNIKKASMIHSQHSLLLYQHRQAKAGPA